MISTQTDTLTVSHDTAYEHFVLVIFKVYHVCFDHLTFTELL